MLRQNQQPKTPQQINKGNHILLDPNSEDNSWQKNDFPYLTLQHQKTEKARQGVYLPLGEFPLPAARHFPESSPYFYCYL